MVVVRLVEPDVVFCVDDKITRVNVVAFHHHFKDLRLVDLALFHEIDNLVLNNDCMVYVVIQLYLHFVLKLALLRQEILLVNWICEIFVVLSEQVELADVAPRVEPVAERVLSEEPHVLAASQEEELVDFAL